MPHQKLIGCADVCIPKGGNLNVLTTIYPTSGEWRWHVLVNGAGFAHGDALNRDAAQRYAQEYIDRRCRKCGCTLTHACAGGCYWLEPDLCSACK